MTKSKSSIPMTMDSPNSSHPFIQTWFNPRERKPVSFKTPSETKPNLALSIRQILEKHTSVRSISIKTDPQYDKGLQELGVNQRQLDLTQIEEIKIQNQQVIDSLKSKLTEQEKIKNAIEHDKLINNEVEKRLAAKKEQEKIDNA